jgi:hypothetical protein
MVLRSADLPSGWTGTPSGPDPEAVANSTAMMVCVGARDIASDKVAEANSSDFSHDTATIGSFTTSYRSQSGVDSATTLAHDAKVSECFGQLMKKQLATSLPSGSTITSSSVKIVPGPAGEPATVVDTGTASVQVTLHGHKIAEYLTAAFIVGPLVLGEVYAFNLGGPVSASVTNPLIATVAARVGQG